MLAVLAAGLPLIVLETPGVTQSLVARYAQEERTGLPPARTLALAEKVRAFVVRGDGELPDQVDGRAGFDASAVSHLLDVRAVLWWARLLTGLIAAGVAVWLAWAVARRRLTEVATALKVGAGMSVAAVIVVAAVAVADFDTFFSAFHGLFFESGTWTFSADSLLIQLFPEPLWATLGALWAALVGLVSACYWVAGALLGKKRFSPRA
jgi:integral membrane protein (TIGR01906 family)